MRCSRWAGGAQRRLGLNSSESGSLRRAMGDEPARARSRRNRPEATGGKSQKGETLRQVAEPNVVVKRTRRPAPGAARAWIRTRVSRQRRAGVRSAQSAAPRRHRVSCGPSPLRRFGAQMRAPFPEGYAPVQYGPRIGAFVLDLLHYQLLPEKRLVELMADLLGETLAAATIARISRDFARRSPRLPQMRCGITSPRRRSRTWTRPAFGSAARRDGCMSPTAS